MTLPTPQGAHTPAPPQARVSGRRASSVAGRRPAAAASCLLELGRAILAGLATCVVVAMPLADRAAGVSPRLRAERQRRYAEEMTALEVQREAEKVQAAAAGVARLAAEAEV